MRFTTLYWISLTGTLILFSFIRVLADGLYKFNQNSLDTIGHLKTAMDDVVEKLNTMEKEEQAKAIAKSKL